jgi:hypothetical protein
MCPENFYVVGGDGGLESEANKTFFTYVFRPFTKKGKR